MKQADSRDEVRQAAKTCRNLDLSGAQLAHLELLMAGFYGPLRNFPARQEYARMLLRKPDGDQGELPVPPFEVEEAVAQTLRIGERLTLRDSEGVLLAMMTVCDVWRGDELPEGIAGVSEQVRSLSKRVFIGGNIEAVEMPAHYDFPVLRLTADELHKQYGRHGWRRVLACQPAQLIHRAEAARIAHAAHFAQAGVLVQVLATEEQTVTLEHYSRVRCIEHCLSYLSDRGALMSLMPMPQLSEGISEIYWRALVAHSAGATHLLVEPEWWGKMKLPERESLLAVIRQLGLELVDLPHFARDDSLGTFLPLDRDQDCPGGPTTEAIMADIRSGIEIAEWISFPAILAELRRCHPVRERQGITVFFTGLSGAGKSTIARVLLAKLLESRERTVTLLDGDIVRRNLSSELGFSRQHRDLNIQRIGFVASEITKHGGIAICAPIAPYRESRRQVRQMVAGQGGFFEVHVATPLETCEARDRKGLYAKARAGLIKEFTGISDPYEIPEQAELVIDTRDCTPLEAAQLIIHRLRRDGFLGQVKMSDSEVDCRE